MGLDIKYFSHVKEDSNGDLNPNYNGFFTYQLGSLKKDKYYSQTDESESGSFRAGSYGGYNEWRNKLAQMAGYGSASNVWQDFNVNIRYLKLKKIEGKKVNIKPFYELINFSDCEGLIGPEICKKLYQDFLDFDEKAKLFNNETYIPFGNFFYAKYQEWKEAFRVASDNGLVLFC